jgi:mannitol/fructose-specific phosphotransferase system IIA component (Ntr-type)
MKLSALIENRLGIEVLSGNDPDSVFDQVSSVLVGARAIPPEDQPTLKNAFVERERQGTTAFGFGIAIPHVFHPGLDRIHLVVARHPHGLAFGAFDGVPTTTLLCVAGPESQREGYLKLLGQIAKTLRDRNWRRFIQQAPSTSAVFDVLLEACPE